MNVGLVMNWIEILHASVTTVLAIFVWLLSRQHVTAERISQLEADIDERLDKHGDRLTRLEVSAGAAPTHEDLKRLHQRLDSLNGELHNLTGQFKITNETLLLIHEHLLNGMPR